MLKSTATWELKRLYLDLLACKEISKKLKKSERCVVMMVVKKWRVSRQEKNGKTENP